MSISWRLGSYDNDSKQDQATLKFQKLHMASEYGKDTINGTETKYANGSSSRTQPEYITYRAKSIPKVNSDIKVSNPAAVKTAMQATIQIDTIAVSTDSVTGNIVEYPCKSYLTINVPNAVPDSIVEELINRQISAAYNDAFDECRFTTLLRGVEDVKED